MQKSERLEELARYFEKHPESLQVGTVGYFFDDLDEITYGDDYEDGLVLSSLKNWLYNETTERIEYYRDKDENDFNYFLPKKDFVDITENNYSVDTIIARYKNGANIAPKHEIKEEIKESYTIGEKNMNSNEMLNNLVTMKMVDAMSKGGDMDIGKLMLMQSLTKGQPIKITDVIKSKIISNLKLDGDDLPLEKVMLLQMLDEGQLDVNQLITFKMIGSMFDDSDKTDKK